MSDYSCIVLAAGRGKRMKSDLPKVMHNLLGRPLLFYPLRAVERYAKEPIVVYGYGASYVLDFLSKEIPSARPVLQKELNGTGGAVKAAISLARSKYTIILSGDMPFISTKTISKLIKAVKSGFDGALACAEVDCPKGLGRVVIDKQGLASSIVEDTDATPGQRENRLVNIGAYIFLTKHLQSVLEKLNSNNAQREYYLTDVIGILKNQGGRIKPVMCEPVEGIGINSRAQLSQAAKILLSIKINQLMENGVTIVMPENVYIEWDVKIGKDTIIYPFTCIASGVRIGKGCSIGPFATLRGDTVVKDGSIVGNFVELNRSMFNRNVYAKHLSYIGDTIVGEGTNIGAGTIVANYDGVRKNKTQIGKKAFVGSGSILIAPVKVGKGAVIGAGAVVTKNHNVPDGGVVVGVPARLKKVKKG